MVSSSAEHADAPCRRAPFAVLPAARPQDEWRMKKRGTFLVRDGFEVLNRDRTIPFPSTGQQKEFQQQFGAILRSAEIVTHETRL
jgi:hypothetical protein